MSNLADLFSSASEEPKQTYSSDVLLRDLPVEDVFNEIPVSLDVFIKDKRYLGEPYFKTSPIQTDFLKHVERVYYPETYAKLAEYDSYWSEPVRMTNFHVCCWGKSGGKDSCCRMACLRIAYLLGCMKVPQHYFSMPEDDSIHMLNIAISASQAQKAYFDPLTKFARRGWFKDKTEITKSSVKFSHNIEAISGNSETESQEGLNLILGIGDEIDGFKTKAELDARRSTSSREASNSAEAIISMMQSSAATRFPETFKFVAISWPRYVGSTIEKLTAQYKKDNEKYGPASVYYASGPHATWEVRTDRFKSQFKPQFEADPQDAAAKYECKPSLSANPYFRDQEALKDCMREVQTPPVEVSFAHDGHSWKPVYDFAEDFYPITGAVYAMHADLAINGDRAGIAMAHQARLDSFDKDVYSEDGTLTKVTERRSFVKVDFVIAYEADMNIVPAREIQIQWALDLMAELRTRGFNIRQMSYDGYQSTHSRQLLEAQGTESPLLSTDRSEILWRTLRDLFYTRQIELPFYQLLFDELCGLTRFQNGKVDHQAHTSKDMADSLAGAVTGAIMLGGIEDSSGTRAYYTKPDFITFAPVVDMLEGKTMEHLAWGTDTHDAYTHSIDSWGFGF